MRRGIQSIDTINFWVCGHVVKIIEPGPFVLCTLCLCTLCTALRFYRIEFVAVDPEADAFFSCPPSEVGPAVRFASDRTSIRGVPYVFDESDMDVVLLFKATDGSLMVNYRTERIFLTSVIVGSQGETLRSAWWRYPPVASKP